MNLKNFGQNFSKILSAATINKIIMVGQGPQNYKKIEWGKL